MDAHGSRRRITRREALRAGGAAALSTALWSPSAHAATYAKPGGLKRSTYLGLADRRFGVRFMAGAGLSLFTLAEIEDLPRAATLAKYRGAETAFSLAFDGPPGWPQGTYRFANLGMRPLDIFITPVGPAGASQRYEAVFDRLYKPTLRTPAPSPGDPRRD
jgi:hypothetical protein